MPGFNLLAERRSGDMTISGLNVTLRIVRCLGASSRGVEYRLNQDLLAGNNQWHNYFTLELSYAP